MKNKLPFFVVIAALVLAGGLAALDLWRPVAPSIAASFPEKTSAGISSHLPTSGMDITARRAADFPTVESLKENVRKALKAGDYQQLAKALPELAHVDPVAAGAFAKSASEALRGAAIQWVVQSWAEDDPYAALKWAAALSKDDERDSTICFVCEGVARTDPEAAISLLKKYGIRPDAIIYKEFAGKWALEDFDAAQAWAVALPPADYRAQIFVRLTAVLAKADPEGAIRLLLKEIPPGKHQSDAALEVILEWARSDRIKAAAWVATFPEGDLKQKAVDALAGKRSFPPAVGWD